MRMLQGPCSPVPVCNEIKPMDAKRKKTTAAPSRRELLGTADQNPTGFDLIAKGLMGDLRLCLHHLRSPQIVKVNDALQFAAFIDHDQRGDLALLHDCQGRSGEFFSGDSLRCPCHAFGGGEVEGLFATALEETPEIAVADYAQQFVAICR